MTLKSLNTRYVKLIEKLTGMIVGLLLAAVSLLSPTPWFAEATGFNRRPAEADNSIPALQGAAAITYLKDRKLYDSVITRLFVDEQKLTASDGAFGDNFGQSVAISGSTVVVGARADTIGADISQGSAYVFNRQGRGWVEEQKLTASDGAVGDQFGLSVAISGSTIVVGAWLDDIGGNAEQGSAYVFNRQGGSWVETQKLTASDGAAVDFFGWSVAISGSTVVVGAFADNTFQGSAYVFNRQGGSWVETQKLTASDGVAGDQFGTSVAISGSTVVVSALTGAIGGNLFEGSAYVFNRQGGSWVEEQRLTANDGRAFNLFGWSVAISGSTVVVSARGDTIGANFNQGSAYVFNRKGGSWVEEQKLTASDGGAFDEFGTSVAIDGSTIVVGAAVDATGGKGSAYVFNRQGGSWVEEQKLTASDGMVRDFFGSSVAISGSTVVVGSVNDTIGGNFAQGSAYVFEP